MPEHRLLACFAHPDDEAFPVGGALASHTRRGVEVRLVTTTLGEEGEIRQEESATRETLGRIREVELSCAVQALRLGSNDVWGYRDSGMQGWDSNNHPKAFINAGADEVVERLVLEIRRFRPQVVLTFGPDGLYGHPDHIAISNHTTTAFHLAADPSAFPGQLAGGLELHQPERLFYSVRPRGFRRQWAEALRGEGIDWPWPSAGAGTAGSARGRGAPGAGRLGRWRHGGQDRLHPLPPHPSGPRLALSPCAPPRHRPHPGPRVLRPRPPRRPRRTKPSQAISSQGSINHREHRGHRISSGDYLNPSVISVPSVVKNPWI